jgi:hypothetical protein
MAYPTPMGGKSHPIWSVRVRQPTSVRGVTLSVSYSRRWALCKQCNSKKKLYYTVQVQTRCAASQMTYSNSYSVKRRSRGLVVVHFSPHTRHHSFRVYSSSILVTHTLQLEEEDFFHASCPPGGCIVYACAPACALCERRLVSLSLPAPSRDHGG